MTNLPLAALLAALAGAAPQSPTVNPAQTAPPAGGPQAPGRRPAAASGARDPVGAVREAERALRAALAAGASREALAAAVAAHVDYAELARRSLGKAWARQKPADREALVAALKALLEETYLPRLQPGAAGELEATLVRSAGAEATVRATVASGGQRVPLELDLVRGKDGRWRVYSAVVAGLAILEGYQEQFPQLLKLGGMPKLLETLERERQVQLRRRPPPPPVIPDAGAAPEGGSPR